MVVTEFIYMCHCRLIWSLGLQSIIKHHLKKYYNEYADSVAQYTYIQICRYLQPLNLCGATISAMQLTSMHSFKRLPRYNRSRYSLRRIECNFIAMGLFNIKDLDHHWIQVVWLDRKCSLTMRVVLVIYNFHD